MTGLPERSGRYAVMQKERRMPGPVRIVHSDDRLSHSLAEAEARRTTELEVWVYDRVAGRAVVEQAVGA